MCVILFGHLVCYFTIHSSVTDDKVGGIEGVTIDKSKHEKVFMPVKYLHN